MIKVEDFKANNEFQRTCMFEVLVDEKNDPEQIARFRIHSVSKSGRKMYLSVYEDGGLTTKKIFKEQGEINIQIRAFKKDGTLSGIVFDGPIIIEDIDYNFDWSDTGSMMHAFGVTTEKPILSYSVEVFIK